MSKDTDLQFHGRLTLSFIHSKIKGISKGTLIGGVITSFHKMDQKPLCPPPLILL